MLHTLFLAFLAGAVLFFILTVKWESIALGVLDIILWFILSITIYEIEIPYVAIQSDNTIIEGVQTINTLYPFSWLFILIGFITLLYWLTILIFPLLQGKMKRMI